ncbi:MAG: TM2 domain-containing protein [Chloroflexi bacterium]|nr:TM2 domain-containing protein [Chloroflexota bacterium]
MKPKKNPGRAVLLSAFIPGMGQFYNGEWAKGIFFLLTWITMVTWPFAVTDAWDSAVRINQADLAQAIRSSKPTTARA